MKKLIIFSLFGVLLFCLCGCKNQSYTIGSTVITITNAEEIEVPIVVVKSDKKAINESGNYLPIFDDLTLSITGLSTYSYSNIFDRNLVVKLTATNADDIDGGINYFKWYYYYKDDPDRLLETKITPGTVNYTYFELKNKEPGEYMFGVTIYDNDEGKTVSEEILGNGPTLLLTYDSQNIDIPIVTLKINKNNVKIGEEVTFHVFSNVISERSDFDQERTIRYDFDGDGEWDLITKDDEVTYVYEKPNINGYTPRVGVLYRGYMGHTNGGSIVVKDVLVPNLLITNAGKFVLFRDMSTGSIEKNSICLSVSDCKKNDDEFLLDSKKRPYWVFEYPEYKRYLISMDLEDDFAEKTNKMIPIELTGIETDDGIVNYTGDVKLLSIPESTEIDDGTIEIFVGDSLDNSVLFYVLNERGTGECYVDLDISDTIKKDFGCGELYFMKYTPQHTDKIGRIYYEKDGMRRYKEFFVSFLDYSVGLDDVNQKAYDKIGQLVKNTKDDDLKVLLINLQEGLLKESETQANIIALNEYLENQKKSKQDETEAQEISGIINILQEKMVLPGIGGTEYDVAKAEILGILPINLRAKVLSLFNDFEIAEFYFEKGTSQQDERKNILQEIVQTIISKTADDLKNQKDDEISKMDLDEVVIPNICKIMGYYKIVNNSSVCGMNEKKLQKK